MRAEEEREDRRLAEQREKISREYEEEQESRKRRELEVRQTRMHSACLIFRDAQYNNVIIVHFKSHFPFK